jgi:hypothetical protein
MRVSAIHSACDTTFVSSCLLAAVAIIIFPLGFAGCEPFIGAP